MAKDPVSQIFDTHSGTWGAALEHVAEGLWEYRVELAWVLGLGIAYGGLFLATQHRPVLAGILLTIGVLFLLALFRLALVAVRSPRGIRRRFNDHFAKASIARRWKRAIGHQYWPLASGAPANPPRIPITKVERFSGGYRLRVRVGGGISFSDINERKEKLAASLAIRELQVERDDHNAQEGTITLLRREPVVNVASRVFPDVDAPGPQRVRTQRPPENGGGGGRYARARPVDPNPPGGDGSLWSPIPIGTDENDQQVTITLPERNLLVGGLPGSGKSNGMSMLLARAALDPDVRIYLVDGKMLEFAEWEDCADSFAHDIGNAIYTLTRLKALMDERLAELRREGTRRSALGLPRPRKIERSEEFPLYALFIDELAMFTLHTDSRSSKDFIILLMNLVAMGRAAGVIVCAATQKPEGSVVPTNLRDLFAYRWALRCTTPDASDTILGKGWASRGYNAMHIRPEEPGVGYLLAEDGVPQRMRAYHVTDDHVRTLAGRAREGRRS